MLCQNRLDEPQSPPLVLHPGVHLDRFQRSRRGKVNAQPRRMQLRVVDRPFDRPAQQAADDVAADRWAPSPARDSGWHVMIFVANEVRRRCRDINAAPAGYSARSPNHDFQLDLSFEATEP